MTNVIGVIGAGSIGQAIARRVSAGKQVLLADLRQENADAAAKTLIDAGFNVTTATVDVASRASVHALVEKSASLGEIFGVIHAAGVSPSQASPETILKVDLYGTALVLEEFGREIAQGGSGVVIASQSGHRLPPLSTEQNAALATTPVEELLKLPFLQPDQVKDSLHAYQLSKRGNSLRVMAEAVRWGNRGARVNTISPGIIITPLANDELTGPRGAGYRRMIEACAAKRAGTSDEVGTVGALLMGPDGAFITGSDFLMDGGVTASYWVRRTRAKITTRQGCTNLTRILILGAYGQIARVATKLFLGHTDAELTLYLRNASRLKDLENAPRVRIVEGSVLDKKILPEAMTGQDVVYANLDGQLAEQARCIIETMKKTSTKRLIFVSSMGIYGEVPGQSHRSILDPYRDAARLIEESDLDYTIIRPEWLNNDDEINYGTTQKGESFKNPAATVSRKSVADLIVKLATTPGLEVRRSLGVHRNS